MYITYTTQSLEYNRIDNSMYTTPHYNRSQYNTPQTGILITNFYRNTFYKVNL